MRSLRCIATAACAVLFATSFAVAVDELVWKDLFAPPYATNPTIAMSIQCVSKNLCFVPGGSNGQGFGVYQFDGKTNGNLVMMNEPNMTMMIMTSAMGGTEKKPVGAFGGLGLLSISQALQYLANGTTWLPSHTPFEFLWETQSMRATDDGQHIISLGSGPAGNSIMHSSNAGLSFNPQSFNITQMEVGCTDPNYAAMIDGNTWFITLGGYPGENHENSHSGSHSHGGSSSSFDKEEESKEHMMAKFLRIRDQMNADSMPKNAKASKKVSKDHCHFTGQVAKTTDAGKTWTVVYSTTEYTITQIDCISATHCVTVGWGTVAATNASISVILVTTDGTNWKEAVKLVNSPIGFNAVQFADAQEVWVAGGYDQQQSGAGVFFVSKDGGATWTQSGSMIPNIMMIMDMSFTPDGVGFAVAITQFQTSTILRYEKQEFMGYFTQSNCPVAGCTFLCQNMTFAQGMCLQTQGGSATVSCSATQVVQKIYQTTSCIGSFTTASMPLNQCLNSTNGGFFMNYCNTTVDEEKPVKQSGFLKL